MLTSIHIPTAQWPAAWLVTLPRPGGFRLPYGPRRRIPSHRLRLA